ncbi:MAG: ribbon-helix-helix protein, CopG family [Patescibacteria group bacterium]
MAKHRLQFDFDDVAIKEIEELRKATALPTRAELVRQALRFFQWTFNETKEDGKLLIEKEGSIREVIFPFWNMGNSSCGGKVL